MIDIRWVPADEYEEDAVITILPGTGWTEAMKPQVLKLQFQREQDGNWYTARICIE